MNLRQTLLLDIADILCGDNIYHLGHNCKELLRQVLKVDSIRVKLILRRMNLLIPTKCRFYKESLQTDMIDIPGKDVVSYNLEGVFNDPGSARSSRLIKPLSCIERIRPLLLNNRTNGVLQDLDIEIDVKLLCIGPRTEAEPLLLWSYGFRLESITCIDLISYSPLIDLGDMHQMPYSDSSFDVVFCSCTLVYSKNIPKAIAEFKRVAKKQAIFALMFDIPNEEYRDIGPLTTGSVIFSPEDIVNLFFPLDACEILYRQFDLRNLKLLNGSSSIVIFKERSLHD